MNNYNLTNYSDAYNRKLFILKLWRSLHIDLSLLIGILLLSGFGLLILYSAANKDMETIMHQVINILFALGIMFVLAQISPNKYSKIAPWLFTFTIILLLAVLGIGIIGKGAQRWLNVGLFRFQPSEIMKIAMPMMLAWYFKDKELPPSISTLIIATILLLLPSLIIAKQPDLGTAVIIAITGIFVIFLTGINWKIIGTVSAFVAIACPVIWHFMHDYQKERVLTFLNPGKDPLKSGYHIIQSKIAIGSGGLLGKGWLHGGQTHLQFLPAHTTDFIFAVCGEELGLIGCIFLLAIFLFIVGRGLYISIRAQDTFTRLLAGSLTLTFFVSFFVNVGMVVGILPVVGIPLPLISYGGTSIVTLMAAFGIIMSIQTHRKLLES